MLAQAGVGGTSQGVATVYLKHRALRSHEGDV